MTIWRKQELKNYLYRPNKRYGVDCRRLKPNPADLLYPERRVPGRKPKIFRAKRGKKKELVETYYPHKYAIQITTDSPQWGGLSGCTFEEAMSWGKEDVLAPKVQCYCDATIALPIVSHSLNERIKNKRKAPNLLDFLEKQKNEKE